MTDQVFASTAPAYYAAGVPVIPLFAREKRPVPEGWSRYHDMPVEAEQQADWIRSCDTGNIGVVLGAQSGMCMLDIDTEDEAVIALLRQLVPASPWKRIGQKGMVLAFRHTGIKTFRIKDSKGASICELLSDRTQVVLPPSIHPKTQEPYTANCELLDVIDQLPPLDPQIETILRGALKEHGLNLSLSGNSRVTDYVSAGSRDTTLTGKAGLFSYAVIRGERTLKEAIGMLRSYEEEFVEQVAGDSMDIDKHITNMLRFLQRDVMEKNKQLPKGWDDGLTAEEKVQLGLQFDHDDEEWSFDELRLHLRDEFERYGTEDPRRMKAVEYVLGRVSRSESLSALDEGRLLQYIADVSDLGLRVPVLRNRVRELRTSGIAGVDHAEIAKAVLGDLEQLNEIRKHGTYLWKYNGSHWEQLEDDEVMARIAKEYGHMQAARRHSDHKGILATLKTITTSGIRDVDIKGVNFANGFLDEELELHPHDHKYGMTYTLPFRYLPAQAGNSPHFFQFLDDCWGHDEDLQEKKDALQEALCVTLFGMGPRLQRAILCKGVAKSGKTQLLTIAQSLVPDEARSFVPPHDWADKFLITQLNEKLINLCGELSEKKFIDGSAFKDIIDGTERNGQDKGQPIFKFRPKCTHWFASNHMPKTEDSSEGFNRRWLVLEFNRPVPAEKRRLDIGDIIVAEEREAIVAWAVLAMPRLLKNNEFTLPSSHHQFIRELAQQNNSVRFFMEESPTVRVVQDSPAKQSTRISEAQLYKEYWSFCFGPGGAKPVGLRAFRQRMKELQHSLGFETMIQTNSLGGQDVFYTSVTVVSARAA